MAFFFLGVWRVSSNQTQVTTNNTLNVSSISLDVNGSISLGGGLNANNETHMTVSGMGASKIMTVTL